MVQSPDLKLLRLQIKMRVTHAVALPPCRGSLWKGVLGRQLANTNALSNSGESLYRLLMDPHADDSVFQPARSERPSPVIFDMPGQMAQVSPERWSMVPTLAEAGTTLEFGLTLVGQAAAHVTAVVNALGQAAAEGIGTNDDDGNRGTAEIVGVAVVTPNGSLRPLNMDTLYDEYETLQPECPRPSQLQSHIIHIALATPLRLEIYRKNANTKKAVMPDELEAPHLVTTLVRRVSNLAACHCGIDINLQNLNSQVADLDFLDCNFGFADQQRYSASQDQRIPISGIVGTFSLDLSQHAWLYPYFFLGQFVHVGKGALMGLGALRVLPDQS
jgi:hypothetical protein